MAAMLEVKDLEVAYGKILAVKKIEIGTVTSAIKASRGEITMSMISIPKTVSTPPSICPSVC